MPAHLAISTEDGICLDLELGHKPVSIGRAEGNSVRSLDKRTSRRHAIVHQTDDGGFVIEDAGSSYGLMLNGRAVTRERLADQDLVTAGGLSVQFLVTHASGEASDFDSDGPTGVIAQVETGEPEPGQLREQVQVLIEEQAGLRRELGHREDLLGKLERERDAEREQAQRLQAQSNEQRGEIERLVARLEALGSELRNARGARPEGAGSDEGRERQVAEAQKQVERHAARLSELEAREAQLALRIQEMKKDNDRLVDMNQKLEKREAELMQAVKPALLRVAQLQEEREKMRLQLAQAQADLKDAQR